VGENERFFRSLGEVRRWLERHHADAPELWIGFHKTTSPGRGLPYRAVVDEALCFGWIDGRLRPIDEDRYRVRFSPRRRGSHWSAVNVARMRELIADGRVAPAGLAAFERRDDSRTRNYSHEIRTAALSDDETRTFRRNRRAWAFWEAQTKTYRKQATFWVVSPKRPETRERRLRQLVERSAASEPIAPLRFGYRPRPARTS
jgi:uncharacterized protein YdeI (YjbR/CyaY-like superfamily)